MGRMKELWIEVYDRLYDEAKAEGKTDEEAEQYADTYVEEEHIEALGEEADAAYEDWKDRQYDVC